MIDPTPERAQQAQMTSAEAITELQQMRDVRTRGLAQRKYKVRATNEICALDHALSALRAPSAREWQEKVFLVMASSGEYDDYRSWPVSAHLDQGAAETAAATMQAKAAEATAQYRAGYDKKPSYKRHEALRAALAGSNGDSDFDPGNGDHSYTVTNIPLPPSPVGGPQ